MFLYYQSRAIVIFLLGLLAGAVGVGIGVNASSPPPRAEPISQDPTEELDDEAFELALGRQVFEENCLMCHAAEMTTAQRLTPEQWTAEVEKMIGWGAPVPPEDTQRLLDYLNREFSSDAPPPDFARGLPEKPPADREPIAELPGANLQRGETLHAEHCATCHGPDALGGDLGTNLVAHPVLLDPEAFATILRDGQRRMPGFRLVLTPEDEADILVWLRARLSSK